MFIVLLQIMEPISVQNEDKQKLALGFANLVIDKSILYEHAMHFTKQDFGLWIMQQLLVIFHIQSFSKTEQLCVLQTS